MTPNPNASLYQLLLGAWPSLEAASREAAARIASCRERSKGKSFKTVTRDGVSRTKLYDYDFPTGIAKRHQAEIERQSNPSLAFAAGRDDAAACLLGSPPAGPGRPRASRN